MKRTPLTPLTAGLVGEWVDRLNAIYYETQASDYPSGVEYSTRRNFDQVRMDFEQLLGSLLVRERARRRLPDVPT